VAAGARGHPAGQFGDGRASFFQRWAKYSQTKKEAKNDIHAAARNLSEVIPESYKKEKKPEAASESTQDPMVLDVSEIAHATTNLIEALRTWYERADDWTWWWLRTQTWTVRPRCAFATGGAFELLHVIDSFS
jgi:hypothetical protein